MITRSRAVRVTITPSRKIEVILHDALPIVKRGLDEEAFALWWILEGSEVSEAVNGVIRKAWTAGCGCPGHLFCALG